MRAWMAAFVLGAALTGCLGGDEDLGKANLTDPIEATDLLVLPVEASATVTSQGIGFEPSVEVGPEGTIYVTAPGNNERRYTRLWTSHDDGASFQEIEFASAEHGVSNLPYGWEGDLAIDQAGTAYFVDLSLANTQLARSHDQGRTWELGTPATFLVPGGDREWVAAGPPGMVVVVWNQIPTGFWVAVSQDGGTTFPTQTYFDGTEIVGVGPVEGDWAFAGVPLVSPEGTIHIARASPEGPMLHTSRDGGATFTEHLVHATSQRTSYLMTVPAIDEAGNLYVAWAEHVGGNVDVFYAASTDGGESWQAPVRVSHHGGSSVMPWIAGGSEGHVALAFYGAPGAPGQPQTTDADWYPYLVDVRDAADEKPVLSVARLSDEPVISDPVCTTGLSCNTGESEGNRALADYLQVDIGPEDQAHAVWGDQAGQLYWARGGPGGAPGQVGEILSPT